MLYKSDLTVKLWDWNYKFANPYFKRYLHRRGTLADLNVLLKNKRYYNRFYDVTCGAALFAYHGALQAPRAPTRRTEAERPVSNRERVEPKHRVTVNGASDCVSAGSNGMAPVGHACPRRMCTPHPSGSPTAMARNLPLFSSSSS